MRGAVFDGLDMLWKAALFLALLIALVRLMGKREIRSMSSVDLVIILMISEAATMTIEDKRIPVLAGIVPVVALALFQILIDYLGLQSSWMRSVFSGRPSVLISRGQLRSRELTGLHMNLNDLLAQLRTHGVPNIADVEYAILETDGVLSVIPKADARPLTGRDLGIKPPDEGLPLDVVLDGQVIASSLQQMGRDEAWVEGLLAAQGLGGPRDVLLASVDALGKWYVQPMGSGSAVSFQSEPPGSGTRQGGGSGAGGASGGGSGNGGSGRRSSSGGASGGGSANGGRSSASGSGSGGGQAGASSGGASGGASGASSSGASGGSGGTGTEAQAVQAGARASTAAATAARESAQAAAAATKSQTEQARAREASARARNTGAHRTGTRPRRDPQRRAEEPKDEGDDGHGS